MTRLLIALLAAALLVAGCGGDDDENADTGDAATTAQTQTTPTDTGEDSTSTDDEPEQEREGADDDNGGGGGSDGGAPSGTPRQLEQAVEACKENVQQAPQLSDEAKDDLVELCEQAASGDPKDLREVSRRVCKRIIEDTLPAGEQRRQALRLCDQTGEQ